MQCQLVRISQIPLGQAALRLFVRNNELHASIIEHRCDGRLVVLEAEQAGIDGIVPTVSLLLERHPDLLHVVLEGNAYWPSAFPKLRQLHK